ncbi:hypothetical protein MUP77_04350, partial [Candidatus Bathyarchaeota archaeon]|nr:hypothetical protein [Candidatus Bathyarchaeota archaeon]
LNIVNLAREILESANPSVKDIQKLWISARKYIIIVFQQLGDRFLSLKNKPLLDLIEKYKAINFSFKKNLQYLILCKIKGQRIYLLNILKRKSIEKHLQCALFYLMLSLNEDMSINNESLKKVFSTLFSIGLSDPYDSYKEIKNNELWQNAKKIIFENWLMACGKSIV